MKQCVLEEGAALLQRGDLLELGYSLFTVCQTMIDIMDVVLPHNQVPAADIDMLGEFSA